MPNMAYASIIGVSGYAGQETLDRVLAHPELELYAVGSDTLAGRQAIALDGETSAQPNASRQARWHLHAGDAFVQLSRYREGRDNIEVGLRLMKRTAPASRGRQITALVDELVRQAIRLHRVGAIEHLEKLSRAEVVVAQEVPRHAFLPVRRPGGVSPRRRRIRSG